MSASKQKLYYLIQLTAHALKNEADRSLLDTAGITTAQSATLSLIAHNEPVNQRFLADELSQNESAITTMVSRLQAQGFVTKKRCGVDRRAWLLEATVSGQAALMKAQHSFDETNLRLDSALDSASTALIAESLKKILKHLKGH